MVHEFGSWNQSRRQLEISQIVLAKRYDLSRLRIANSTFRYSLGVTSYQFPYPSAVDLERQPCVGYAPLIAETDHKAEGIENEVLWISIGLK